MAGPPLQPSQEHGLRTREPAYPSTLRNEKNKGTATILSLLLGGLGIHRFYLGKPVSGLFYFLFCWTFIPLLLGIGEFVQLVFMDDDEFHARYSS
jgi:TM2 domain-containing membrane protein YozV